MRGKISPLRFTTNVTEGVRRIWTLLSHDKDKKPQTQSFYTKHLTKKKTQHLQLITTQSATPLTVQYSSSRTYCYFHVPTCQYTSELAQSGCLWLGSHAYCLCYD